MSVDRWGTTITEKTWANVDLAIKSFCALYPRHWEKFKKELAEQRTEYQLALEGDLRKSGFRNTCSFPVVLRPKTKEEIEIDPNADDETVVVDSLKDWLDKIIPGFTLADKPGKPNKVYGEFLRRYPVFKCGDKM